MMKQSALADAGQVRALPHRVQLKAAGGQPS
jgi:hypothetical protein